MGGGALSGGRENCLQPKVGEPPRYTVEQNWNAVVEGLGPKLFRYFRARFSHEQASDLTQETLIRLVQKARSGEFNPARGTLRMYAYGIAHFVALEALKSGVREEIAELEPDFTLEAECLERQRARLLRSALIRLEPVQTQILSFMIDEELSLTDIAQLLALPLGTVKSHVHRAKARLREILNAKECL